MTPEMQNGYIHEYEHEPDPNVVEIVQLRDEIARWQSATEFLRKAFHDFQNSPYRGEWNQHVITLNAGQLRDVLAKMPGGRYGDVTMTHAVDSAMNQDHYFDDPIRNDRRC